MYFNLQMLIQMMRNIILFIKKVLLKKKKHDSTRKFFVGLSVSCLLPFFSLTDCQGIDKTISNLIVDVTNTLFFPSAGISTLLCLEPGT
jgi:hypothetical protein